MKEASNQEVRKYIFWVILVLLFVLSFWVIKPFITALISAFILAYLIEPLHKKISLKLNNKFSAIVCVIIILGIIIIPLLIVTGAIINQISFSENINFNSISKHISAFSFLNNLDLNSLKTKALSILLSLITSIISYLPYLIISILITLLGTYYILINWNFLSSTLEALLPFKNKKAMRKEISGITQNIVHGYLLIAILEFIVAAIGFYIAGTKAFILLACLIALFAFIPGIGPGMVWIPTLIYYIFNQNYFSAAIVLITGLTISILIETILLGKIIGKKSNISPFIFLLGVLGGVPIFGIFGFIIGPLILVYSIKIIQKTITDK
ncbi:MAG: AI-2E family transporter [Nanoarchaeota archaeon]